LQRDVILGHADLLGNFDNLNLDINLNKLLGERVDVDKTGVDSAGKSTELGDQANVSLVHGLVRVRAADAAGDSAECTDDSSKSVDHPTVPAVAISIGIIWLDDLCVAGLQVFTTRRLNLDDGLVKTASGRAAVSAVDGHWSFAVV